MNATHHSPGLFTEALGQAAYVFNEVQPYLPMYLHLILSALFPIFTGAHASLVRPSSAAKPDKAKKRAKDDGGINEDEDEDEDDDEQSLQKMEGLSNSDAIMFPLLAGSTLVGLYFLIKWFGPAIINKVLGWYFSSIAIFSVAKLLNDGFAVLESFCWPDYYSDQGVIWQVTSSIRSTVDTENGTHPGPAGNIRMSPLPGVFGRIALPPIILNFAWSLRDFFGTKYSLKFHLAKVVSFKITLTLRTIFSTILGLVFVLVSNFVSKAWWLTNLQGFAFSYNALQLMSPTTFSTGSLILAALFFYDIYFVFYTPMMVSVATNLDVPIKLLFPRPAKEGETVRRLAMLGLGDIVLPGIMIGLALRFDLWMHYLKKQGKKASPYSTETAGVDTAEIVSKKSYRSVIGHWGNSFWTSSWTGRSRFLAVTPPVVKQPSAASRNALIPTFRKTYFYASITGYVAGMCATLGIMQVYHHAQPALLYLVPGVLGSLWLTGLVRGELKEMLAFTEAEEGDIKPKEEAKDSVKSENKEKSDKESKESWWSRSFFSSSTAEKNAKILEQKLARSITQDNSTLDDAPTTKSPSETNEAEDTKDKKGKEKTPETPKKSFAFKITRVPARRTKQAPSPKNSADTSSIEASNVSGGENPSANMTSGYRQARVSDDSTDQRPEKRLRTR